MLLYTTKINLYKNNIYQKFGNYFVDNDGTFPLETSKKAFI